MARIAFDDAPRVEVPVARHRGRPPGLTMRFGHYVVTPEQMLSIVYLVTDSWRVRYRGVPRLADEDPAAMARQTLRDNGRGVLNAGTGHFRVMWVSDFGKALRGALKALDHGYLRGLITYMVRESGLQGRVTSCFTARRGFDMPYYRGDNLPWLAYSIAEYASATGDRTLIEECRPIMQSLLDDYERTHFERGLIAPSVTGDWMDTILRPSSTYNNLCALRLIQLAPNLGLRCKTDSQAFQERILEDRWRGHRFTDYAGTENFGVDAGVLALYFGQFDETLRKAVVAGLEAGGFAEPLPMRVAQGAYDTRLMPFLTRLTPRYHSSIWLHLGLMYLNGLARAGFDTTVRRKAIENVFIRHGHVIEAVGSSGELYSTFFHSTEYGLSMAAGQYLELVGG